MKKKVIFWFRRDLRLEDNTALYRALKSGHPVVPLFIFDTHILDALEDRRDQRVRFIHQTLAELDQRLRQHGSSLQIRHGKPVEVWRELINELDPAAVFTNRDYEPYARQRDEAVADLLQKNDIYFYDYKDQVIFEKDEVLTQQGTPYTVYTPYRRRWEELL
ncbi:MAG TPA: deoxyribodipyrimidine photo-lyase, partial [Calditrichia bacterium]|nr:deoxyribodipyrimidine photo-lyase [Calditrichia bacterium]